MAKQTLTFGTPPTGIGGDSYRTAFSKCNENFTELYGTTASLASSKLNATANAVSATKLATATKVGGVLFDGTADITLPGVNATGNQSTTGNAASATKLQTARTIGGISFNGTANINLPGVNIAGNQSTTGNAATATKLATARTITLSGELEGSVSIDGTKNVTLNAVTASTIMTANMDWNTLTTAGTYYGAFTLASGVNGPPNLPSYGFLKVTRSGLWIMQEAYGDSSPARYQCRFSVDGGVVWKVWTEVALAATATKLATARKINGVNFDGTANIEVPVPITTLATAGADLNTFQSPGFYSCPANATAKTLLNCPTTNAFALLVEQGAGVIQTLTEYMTSSTKIYKRHFYSSWGPWYRVYTSIDEPIGGQFLGTQAVKAIAYNAKNISENITIPGTYNGLSAGPITIDTGKTVTVADGATWTIV